MKMMKLLVITTLLAVAFAYDINTIVRDFTPATCADFQSSSGSISGCVANNLDNAHKPVDAGCAVITSQLTFAEWYRSTDGANLEMDRIMTLTLSGGAYSYSSASYFPVDGVGYGNYMATGHNWHFTTEIDATATYASGDYITISSSDACWLFINGALAGSTSSGTFTVSLDSLSLTVGSSVDVRIFQANRHTAASSTFGISTTMQLATSTPSNSEVGRPAYICQVQYPNFCAGSPQPVPDNSQNGNIPSKRDTCPEDPAIHFGGVAYDFAGFNAISFDSFTAVSGDVEGRTAIRNNLHLTSGQYSFGYQMRTGGSAAWDTPYPYALIVGGDAHFTSGAVYPDGSNLPYPGPQENLFVGGSFSGEHDLSQRTTGSCNGNAGCLNDDFDNALAYYMALQTAFAGVTDNAIAHLQYSGLTIHCNDANADSYSVTVPGSYFDNNAFTYYTIENCNANKSQLVINIAGSNNVYFQGDNIHGWRQELILFNILGSGRTINVQTEIDGSVLAPQNTLYQTGGVIKGQVIVGNIASTLQINRLHCPTPAPPVHPTPDMTCPFWEGICTGLDFPLANSVVSFRDFGVISFGGFTADTGDIESRLAARGDVTLGAGYSIGYQLSTLNDAPDNSLPYSLVVGGDLCWVSGAIYPQGNGIPYPGDAEYIFVGGETCDSTAADLQASVTGNCGAGDSECLDDYFGGAQQCYQEFSDQLAALSDNVQQSVQYDALILTCSDNTDTEYVVSIDSGIMNTFTYITTNGCNMQANWVVNIRGTGDVNFNGDSFPAAPGGVVYNVNDCGRTISVTGTALAGSLLAPCSTLHQTGGVIIGKVVAGDITFSLQINKLDCPNPGTVTVNTPLTSDTPGDSDSLPVASIVVAANDQITLNGNTYTVVASSGNTLYIQPALMSSASAGDVVSAQVDASNGRNPGGDKAPNSSSVVAFSVALIAAMIALLF